MSKKFFAIAVMNSFLLLAHTLYGQSDYEAEIKKQFEAVQGFAKMAPENFDPELVVKHTYPPLIEMIGGREQYIETIKMAMEMGDDIDDEDEYYEEEEGPWTLKESGTELGEIGEVYDTGEELQAVIEVQEIDVYSDRKEVLKRYQLAISRDGGDFWYFVDGTMNWKKVVPKLHAKIIQPEEKEETLYNDEN